MGVIAFGEGIKFPDQPTTMFVSLLRQTEFCVERSRLQVARIDFLDCGLLLILLINHGSSCSARKHGIAHVVYRL
jgi:hypothetical protein